jgi:hypothetical protein
MARMLECWNAGMLNTIKYTNSGETEVGDDKIPWQYSNCCSATDTSQCVSSSKEKAEKTTYANSG